MFILSYAATRFCGKGSLFIWGNVAIILAVLSCNALAQSPTITQPPVAPTIFLGDPATFRVTAAGGAPLAYQWFRDSNPIAGATSADYTIPAVAATEHNAVFSVRVTNALGIATSAGVPLTVDFGLPGAAVTNRLVNFNSVWRYDLSNNLDSVNWIAPGYSDASWPSGLGLFGAENNAAILPLIGTILLAPNTPPPGLAQGHAYYFRTTINVASNNLIPGPLVATLRADDGAMVYVNGVEALRLRLPDGPITNTSFTTGFPPGDGSDASTDEVIPLEPATLAPGINLIAASVHQA